MASTSKITACKTSELPDALAELQQMERARFVRLSARLPPQPGNVPHIETPRADLVEYMRLARRVYAHPNYRFAMLDPLPKDECADNSPSGRASKKTYQELSDRGISISQCRLTQDGVHKAWTYSLKVRIISHVARNQYIFFAVEDQQGRVEMVRLAHYWPFGYLPTSEELDLVFPLGQNLALKEPRLVVTKSGFIGFDVVSPTDVVIVDYDLLAMNKWATPHPGTAPTVSQDFKALGNAAFAKSQYYAAIKYYSLGIYAIVSNDRGELTLLGVLRLNRAAAQLRVRNFHQACLDAMDAAWAFGPTLPNTPSQTLVLIEKAYLRAGLAAEALQLCGISQSMYLHLIDLHKGLESIGREGSVRASALEDQDTHGIGYDWMAIFANKGPERHGKVEHCVADHIGPVEPKKLASRNSRMGLVAKRDIAPGELLLVERAYAASDVDLVHDDDRKSLRAYQRMEASLIAKLVDHPGQERVFQALHGDSEYGGPEKMPSHFIVDVNTRIASVDPLRGTLYIDVARDLNIAKNNAIFAEPIEQGRRFSYPPSPMTKDGHLQGRPYYAIYPYSTFMLHSCIPNTMAPARIGDVMFVRARVPIKKGEEVTMCCRGLASHYMEREVSLREEKMRNGDKACQCSACRQDAADTPAGRMRRRELFEVDLPPLQVEAHRIGAALESRSIEVLMNLVDPLAPHAVEGKWSLGKFRGVVAELERTYSPGHGPYKPELAEPLWRLAVVESDFGDCHVALRLLKTAFAALGGAAVVKIKGVPHNALTPGFDFTKGTAIRPTMGVSNTLTTLIVIHMHIVATKLGRTVEASKWLRAALRLENMLMGEPKDFKRFFIKRWTEALQLDVLETPRGRELFGPDGEGKKPKERKQKQKEKGPEKKKTAPAAAASSSR